MDKDNFCPDCIEILKVPIVPPTAPDQTRLWLDRAWGNPCPHRR